MQEQETVIEDLHNQLEITLPVEILNDGLLLLHTEAKVWKLHSCIGGATQLAMMPHASLHMPINLACYTCQVIQWVSELSIRQWHNYMGTYLIIEILCETCVSFNFAFNSKTMISGVFSL